MPFRGDRRGQGIQVREKRHVPTFSQSISHSPYTLPSSVFRESCTYNLRNHQGCHTNNSQSGTRREVTSSALRAFLLFSARRLREPSALSASLCYLFLFRSKPSIFNFQLSTSSSYILTSLLPCLAFRPQLPHQVRNNHLPENHRIRPHFHLPPQVPTLRIDPRLLRHVAAAQQQIRIRDRHLSIQSPRDDQHRRHRLPNQPLRHKRHFRKNVRQVIDSFRALINRHQRRPKPEQILAISQRLVDHKIFLEHSIRRRRLRHHRFQSRMLQNRQLRRPVRAETLAIHADSRFVHFRPRLQVIDHAREFAFRRFARFDRRLPRARRIKPDKTNPVWQDGAKIFGKIFLPAIESADRNHQRNGPFRIFRQPQITDDLRTFKRNAHHFERRIHQSRVGEKCFQRLRIRALLAGRRRHRPAPERIQSPRFDVQHTCLCDVRALERFRLRHVAVGNGTETHGPLVVVGRFDRSKRFAHIGGIKPDQRIHSIFRALDRFGFYFIERPFFLRLCRYNSCARKRAENHPRNPQRSHSTLLLHEIHSLCPFQSRTCLEVIRGIVVFLRSRRMPAPLALHFRSQLEHIFETIEIDARVLHVSAVSFNQDRVRLPRYILGNFRFLHHQLNHLLFVGRGHQPALRLDVRGKISHQRIFVFAHPFTLHESAITLIRPDELLRRAEAHEAFALGHNRCRWTKHRTSKFFVFAHGHQPLRRGAVRLHLVVPPGLQSIQKQNLFHLEGVRRVHRIDDESFSAQFRGRMNVRLHEKFV